MGEGLQLPPLPLPHRHPHVILGLDEVHAAVHELLQQEAFVIDVETTGGNARANTVVWVGLGGPAKVYLIPMGHPKGIQITPERRVKTPAFTLYGPDDPRSYTPTGKISSKMIEHTEPATFAAPPQQLWAHDVMKALRPLLFSDRGKIGHNVKYDLQSVAKYFDMEIPPGPYHDTILIRHTLVEDLQDYSLKALTCDWFGIHPKRRAAFYPNLGAQGIENFGLDTVARYLAKDLRYCWMMFQHFYPRMVRKGLQPVYDFEMEVYPVLMRMEQEGFSVDLGQMDRVRLDLEEKIGLLEQQCWIMAGDQFPLSDPSAKRWVLFGEGKPVHGKSKRRLVTQSLPVKVRTEKEELPAVTQAVLDYFSERGNVMAEFLREWSSLEKLRGTFIEGLSGHLYHRANGELPTLHTSFKQHGTVTGRLSSAQPNLQQLPRGTVIRDLFVAGPGNMLIVADYDQIELRCAAHLSQDSEMIQVFIDGQDIHRLAAATMMRKALEDITDEERQVGKTQNFGTLYGAGPAKIAAVAGCSMSRAQEFIDRYFARFRLLKKWMDKELRDARERGDRSNPLMVPPYVEIPPNKRQRRLPSLYSFDKYERWHAERQAINAIVQGFASNITKQAMIDMSPRLPGVSAMVAQVHDEIVVRCDERHTAEVTTVVTYSMEHVKAHGQQIIGEVPLVASAKVGHSWAEAKGAPVLTQ